MSIRVVQWSTGNVGRHAIAGIDARPELELVGVWVSSAAKAGQD
ncbi:MAG: diacylglycerol kinase, partial [Actinomycetota bacterium]|nr:diacylglycerol kinase [Actinomycetota bacterium]